MLPRGGVGSGLMGVLLTAASECGYAALQKASQAASRDEIRTLCDAILRAARSAEFTQVSASSASEFGDGRQLSSHAASGHCSWGVLRRPSEAASR